MEFKIKIEKEDKADFIFWAKSNESLFFVADINFDYKYFFIESIIGLKGLYSSPKFFKFKYSKLPEYVWRRTLKRPVSKTICNHGVESIHTGGRYSGKTKATKEWLASINDAARTKVEVKPADGFFYSLADQCHEAIKNHVGNGKVFIGDQNNVDHEIESYPNTDKKPKQMKKQTEPFQIDLSKVDMLEAEKVIKEFGGIFNEGSIFTKWMMTLDYDAEDNTFWYSKSKADMLLTITSISQLRKQLGNIPDNFSISNFKMEHLDKLRFYLEGIGWGGELDFSVTFNSVMVYKHKKSPMEPIKITDIFPELKDEQEKPKEKEYVLKENVTVSITDHKDKMYNKGYSVKKMAGRWFSEPKRCYFAIDDKYLVSIHFVEEKQPLLSDVVKFGDELELSTRAKVKYSFAGARDEATGLMMMIYDPQLKKTFPWALSLFNEQFKLKK